MKPDTTFLLVLLFVAAGFTLGALFGGFLTNKVHVFAEQLRHVANVSQTNFNAMHDRLLNLEGKGSTSAVKKPVN